MLMGHLAVTPDGDNCAAVAAFLVQKQAAAATLALECKKSKYFELHTLSLGKTMSTHSLCSVYTA